MSRKSGDVREEGGGSPGSTRTKISMRERGHPPRAGTHDRRASLLAEAAGGRDERAARFRSGTDQERSLAPDLQAARAASPRTIASSHRLTALYPRSCAFEARRTAMLLRGACTDAVRSHRIVA